jgi:FKBP-type peptidyl-prolyl cis-trans isomerase
MKKISGILLFVFLLGGIVSAEETAERDTDISYAFGMVIGSDLKQTGLNFDYEIFSRGLRDAMDGRETRFSMEDAIRLMQAAYMTAMAEQAETNRQEEMAFLEENGRQKGVTVTGSGLRYEVINEGNGQKPLQNDTVRVHYEGSFIDGTVFDSSYSRGEPAEFPLNQVIPGWSEGLRLMNVGGVYRLYIPSSLAYGAEGSGAIPPYAVLIFEVELLAIVDQDF